MELIVDLGGCDVSRFCRGAIEEYMVGLCDLIDMERCDLHFWDDIGVPEEDRQVSPHTVGTSAVQFILTSNITIHTLDILGEAYVNIFSCKDFSPDDAEQFTRNFFSAKVCTARELIRGVR